MKKYIYLAIALVMGVFSSCTDKDEIEIILHHDALINVNVTSMYESTGLLSDYQNYLGNNPSYRIGVTSLVYNTKGELCKEVFASTKTFQDIQLELNGIEDGEYTMITLEMFVNSDNNNLPNRWSIEGKDNIETVRIAFNETSYYAYWSDLFGTTCNNIVIGKDKSVNITPKMKGCLIDVAYENFDKTGFNHFDLSVKNKADGLCLKPNASQPYYYSEYNPGNTWASLGYLHSNDVLPSSDSFTYFYSFETGNVDLMFAAAKNMWVDDNYNFDAWTDDFVYNLEDGKTYVAYCYYKGLPTIFEQYFGLEKDFSSWYRNLDRTMNPIYAEPCTMWGSSVSYVKSFMKGYQIAEDIAEGPYSYYMAYWGKYSENSIEYDFETKTSGLFSVYITILEDNASENDILEMLNESSYVYDRYYDEEDEPYHKYYDDKTYVAVYPNLSDEEGTRYSIVQYMSREMADAEPESSAAKARSVKNVKSNSAKLSFGLSKINKKRILKK